MAVNIGTNYSFKGKQFLDDRQGIIQRKEELKDWKIPVPEGFEVFVEGEWYIYKPNEEPNTVTGQWFPRIIISQEFGNSDTTIVSQSKITERFEQVNGDLSELENRTDDKISLVNEDIFELAAEVFPMTVNITSGGGTYEVGQEITPKISWSVVRKGESISPESVTVNGETEGLSDDKLSYTGTEIKENSNYRIHIEHQRLVADKTVNYTFRYKKYWGTSTESSLTNEEILELNQAFSTSRAMSSTKFDCTGGKYVYYVLPKEQYPGLEVWIGGLKNTDFTATDIKLTNASGSEHDYVVVSLNNIQTGTIYIEFK